MPVAFAADLLLMNGRIYTGVEPPARAEAVLSVGGRITYVGSDAEARRRAPASTRVVDLKGATVLPGLADSHAHLAGIGFRELSFDLEGTTGISDLQARVKGRAAGLAPGAWLVGRGWIESRWSPPRFPTRADIDALVADWPVLLTRADGHAAASLAFSAAARPRGPDCGAAGRARSRDPMRPRVNRQVDCEEPARQCADLGRRDIAEVLQRLMPVPFVIEEFDIAIRRRALLRGDSDALVDLGL